MSEITAEHAMRIALAHHQGGRLVEAERLYRQVLAQFPDRPDALHYLGVLACQTGHATAAIDLIGRAIAVDPTVAEYHNNLGECYRRTGRWEAAIGCFQRAVAINPNNADTYNNLGMALFATGRLDEANAAFRRATALKPDLADAHNNLGNILKEWDRLEEAIAAYRRAIELMPDSAGAFNNLGYALNHSGRSDEAIAAFESAIRCQPRFPDPHNGLGLVLKDQGRLDEALASFRRAVDVEPSFTPAASNFVYTLHFHPDYDAQAILAEHRSWARRYAEPLTSQIRPHSNDRSLRRKLRIAFLSPDFRNHPVGQSLVPLFSHRNPQQSDYVCYSDVRVPDRLTRNLEDLCDEWHQIVGLSDQEVADRVRAGQIDILVDTTLHTAGSRLLVFARKPAPVQVTMLGPPTTTGLATIDYRLTDRYLDPPGRGDQDYTERSIRLPHCFWCYQPPADAPPVGDLPASKNGFVTFGCLNQFAKASRPALRSWLNILQAVPNSRLLIQSPPGSHREAVLTLFRNSGIARDRVEFAARVPGSAYFQRYHELDLTLDPFPYNGHTTTLDSLWMGVPVITLAGRTAVGRGGVSLLSNIGLTELIAATPEEYVEIALRLASDWPRLAELRAVLRPRLESSPLTNGAQFAADVEAVWRRIWQTWCGR
jgi:predicted O-linked N-acetylglucosamine transferase (SPINDLY family)